MTMRVRPSREALLRYARFQLPGIALAGAFSLAAWEWFAVPAWAAGAAFAAWVVKDVAFAHFVAHAYEPLRPGGAHDLVGRCGVAECELAPTGTARIGAERWRAECAPGVERIAAGAALRVVARDGLTAIVEPAESPRS